MPAQSGLGFSGIVAIQIPAGGAVGEVLTKLTGDNYDYDWGAGGGGGGGDVLSLFLTGLLSSVLNLTQSSGVSPLTVDFAPMIANFTLNTAYNTDDTVPQINVNAGQPLTVDALAAGDIFAVRDVANADLVRIATGGSSITGANGSLQSLRLRGTSNANLGSVISESPIVIEDTSAQTAIPYAMQYAPSQTFAAGFIGGGVNISPTITFNNALFIWEGVRGLPVITSGTPPSFAAFTLFQALPRLVTLTSNAPLNALVVNAGAVQEQAGVAVIATAGTSIGLNWAPQGRASGAFGTMNITTMTAVQCTPTYAGTATAAVNFGTINGMVCNQPSLALFQTAPGTITLTAYNGLLFPDFTFGGAAQTVSVINSQLNAGTNKRFLRHTGSARSDFAGNITFPADLVGLTFGASDDVGMGWAGAGFFFLQFNALADQIRLSNPAANRFLMDFNADSELNVNTVNGFSLGAQTGANGNQFGNFVAGAQLVTVNGEYSQFLLTQAGNVSVANGTTLGLVAAWTVNAPSITLVGSGAVTQAGVLNVGGNVNQGSVDRFGVRILSNPAGGSGINAALWVTTGRSQFDGIVTLPRNTDANRGAAGEAGRIIFNTDDGQLNIDDGTNWTLPDGTIT